MDRSEDTKPRGEVSSTRSLRPPVEVSTPPRLATTSLQAHPRAQPVPTQKQLTRAAAVCKTEGQRTHMCKSSRKADDSCRCATGAADWLCVPAREMLKEPTGHRGGDPSRTEALKTPRSVPARFRQPWLHTWEARDILLRKLFRKSPHVKRRELI